MATSKKIFFFGEDQLTASLALDIAQGAIKGRISQTARKKIIASYNAVAHGVSTFDGTNL